MSDLIAQFADLLRRFPEIAVFLTLGLGYLVGKFKVKGFGLGTVVGTLVVGMLVGQSHVEVPVFARTLFFLLFMFATGYHVGPQFFVSLRRGGLKLVIISLTFAFVGLGMTILVAWFLKLDAGFTGGLLSGGRTQSSVIGTASDAINQLPLPEDQRSVLISHVPVGDAVTYVYGTIGVTLLLTKLIFPAIMRVNLREGVQGKPRRNWRASLDKADDQPGFEVALSVDVQAFKLAKPDFVGKTVADLEAGAGPRVQVARLRRNRRAFRPDKRLPLKTGDIIVLSGPREDLIKAGPLLGDQVVDPAAMEVPFQTRTVIVTNKKAVVAPHVACVRQLDEKRGQGIHLRRVTRQGEALPLLPRTIIQRGDAAELIGTTEDLDRVTPLLGVADVPTDKTNFVAMGLTMALGALAGVFAFHIGKVPVGLGAGRWSAHRRLWPSAGSSPTSPPLAASPTLPSGSWRTLGLNAFVAMVGLAAGPHAVEAMKTSGLQLLLASVVVATIPHVITFVVGRYVLRLNAGLLMGALSGAGTVTAALQSLVDESGKLRPGPGLHRPLCHQQHSPHRLGTGRCPGIAALGDSSYPVSRRLDVERLVTRGNAMHNAQNTPSGRTLMSRGRNPICCLATAWSHPARSSATRGWSSLRYVGASRQRYWAVACNEQSHAAQHAISQRVLPPMDDSRTSLA